MISRALSALGFGRKSMPTAIATNDQALRAMTASRDDWKRLAEEAGERFKRAAADLAKQAEEIAKLKVRLHYSEPRAIKWDNSLKRSRDRKAAKNRGGGK